MKNIPTLKTANLILRPFDEDDVYEMYQILRGKEVLRYFPNSSLPSREQVKRMVRNIINHWQDHGYGLWAVESRKEQILMGRCGLQYLPDTAEVEVDFILGNEYWGHGFATEAAKVSLQYGLEKLGINTIVGIVHIDNIASQRVLEKIGMRLIESKEYFGMPCYRYATERR
ncbi:MAG: GNAT family N-acetyltransferase [Candidatus Promineifilaceae bacterium]|nr:GNAT family N-acetyltransferase [Candidatus Promineifilaceae bacterium]